MKKKALVAGITGQDGSYLAELLLDKGYEVHGMIRRTSSYVRQRIDHLTMDPSIKGKTLFLHYGDMTDGSNISRLIERIRPDCILNMAAQSHVKISFDVPEYSAQVDAIGVLRLLDAIREVKPDTRLVHASTSECFGLVQETPQRETTPFYPRSPYAAAKVFAHHICRIYREAYGLFVCNSICFNHEGPRRGENFVTRKITMSVANILAGRQEKVSLGNLSALRDWGYAPEYCIDYTVPILTQQGWKYHDEINIGDKIINFNLISNTLDTDTIEEIIDVQSNGDRVVLSGRGVYIRCTPEHRIHYQHKSKNSKGGWSKWKTITAVEFYNIIHNKALRTKYDFRLPHFEGYTKDDYKLVSDEEIYLVGALLAKGNISSYKLGRGANISLSQSFIVNESTHQKIDNAIDKLGLRYNLYIKNNGVTEWQFSADSTRKILELFDSPNIHIMPRWCYSLSARQANILFTSLMDCDGCWGQSTYSSKRSLLAADFQTIAHIAGRKTTQMKQGKDGQWSVCVVAKNKKYSYITNAYIERNQPHNVWCVKTANSTIITRDNNCISISGNCEAMIMMLEHHEPDDYVIATGENHSVEEFCSLAFKAAGMPLVFRGQGLDRKGYDQNGVVRVDVDPEYFRPTEVQTLLGDASKAKRILGWEPKIKFKELVKLMTLHDLGSQDA